MSSLSCSFSFRLPPPCVFVANHNSWLDIPFLCAAIGRIRCKTMSMSYKFIAKQELTKIPFLSTAIRVGNHIALDRMNRRSQLETYKKGIQLLNNNNSALCIFPEGTCSKTGRLGPFKKGAFAMACKAKEDALIIPVSIQHAATCMPPRHWLLPRRPARNFVKVILHKPVAANQGEEQVMAVVRKAIIEGLPPEQRPL